MKTKLALLLLLISVHALLAQNKSIADFLKDTKGQDELIEALGKNHDFIFKFIDKLSEHPHFVQLMTERFTKKETTATTSPYAGKEGSTIKALTDKEIKQYLDGEGMGLAKPAELNSYPGPRHLLDVAEKLNLDAATKGKVQNIFDAMHATSVRLGKDIVENEKKLDAAFASRKIDRQKLTELTDAIGRLQGKYRAGHLQAHLEVTKLLTADQIARYNALRGYGEGQMPAGHDHH
jgi:Spy/CpxP family protein refolding chaperone